MTSTATLTYTAFLGGASAAQAAALMSAVPVPTDILYQLGLRVISDSTPAASPCVRTIVLGLNPVASAAATAVMEDTGASGSEVKSVTVNTAGSGYTAPPVVSFIGGRSPTPVRIVAQQGTRRIQNIIPSTPGIPQPQNVIPQSADFLAGAQAYLGAVSVAIGSGGSGYSAGTTLQLVGAYPRPGGVQPNTKVPSGGSAPQFGAGTLMVLTPTIVGGSITAVAITNPGTKYTAPPQIVAVDPLGLGSGAVLTVSMGVESIDLLQPGAGYNAAPTVVLNPLFQALFPSTGNQASPLGGLMLGALQQALLSPVSAGIPVIA
jgi:hypothetical protein